MSACSSKGALLLVQIGVLTHHAAVVRPCVQTDILVHKIELAAWCSFACPALGSWHIMQRSFVLQKDILDNKEQQAMLCSWSSLGVVTHDAAAVHVSRRTSWTTRSSRRAWPRGGCRRWRRSWTRCARSLCAATRRPLRLRCETKKTSSDPFTCFVQVLVARAGHNGCHAHGVPANNAHSVWEHGCVHGFHAAPALGSMHIATFRGHRPVAGPLRSAVLCHAAQKKVSPIFRGGQRCQVY